MILQMKDLGGANQDLDAQHFQVVGNMPQPLSTVTIQAPFQPQYNKNHVRRIKKLIEAK
jgi:hypothetical protein